MQENIEIITGRVIELFSVNPQKGGIIRIKHANDFPKIVKCNSEDYLKALDAHLYGSPVIVKAKLVCNRINILSIVVSSGDCYECLNFAIGPNTTQKDKRTSKSMSGTSNRSNLTHKWIIVEDCEKFIAKCPYCGWIIDSRAVETYTICPKCKSTMKMQENEMTTATGYITFVYQFQDDGGYFILRTAQEETEFYAQSNEVMQKVCDLYDGRSLVEVKGIKTRPDNDLLTCIDIQLCDGYSLAEVKGTKTCPDDELLTCINIQK